MNDIQKKLYDKNLKLINPCLEHFHLAGKGFYTRIGECALRRAISFFSERNSLEDAAVLASFPNFAEHFIKSALRLHLELSLPEKQQFGSFATGCSGSLRAIREYKRTGVLPRPQTQKSGNERFEGYIEHKKHQYQFYTGQQFIKNQEDRNVQ